MKCSIEGFSQEYAMTLKKKVIINGKEVERKIDCTDLVILRWFVDFYPNMRKVEVDGKQYAWLTHSKLIEDLPLIDITKRAFIERMQKLVEFGILTYKLVKEGGTFSLYGFGDNYINLITSNEGGMRSNDIGVCIQTTTEDKSIKDSTNKENINIKESSTTKRFVPPTVEEVSAFCKEKGYSVDAEMFVSWYDSNGWKVGKNKMVSWKSAVATWERKNKASKTTIQQRKIARDYDERKYEDDDFKALVSDVNNLSLDDI